MSPAEWDAMNVELEAMAQKILDEEEQAAKEMTWSGVAVPAQQPSTHLVPFDEKALIAQFRKENEPTPVSIPVTIPATAIDNCDDPACPSHNILKKTTSPRPHQKECPHDPNVFILLSEDYDDHYGSGRCGQCGAYRKGAGKYAKWGAVDLNWLQQYHYELNKMKLDAQVAERKELAHQAALDAAQRELEARPLADNGGYYSRNNPAGGSAEAGQIGGYHSKIIDGVRHEGPLPCDNPRCAYFNRTSI